MHELDCNKMKSGINDLRFATKWMCCNFQTARLEREKRRGHQRRAVREAGGHPRRDRTDDRYLAGSREPVAGRSQKAADCAAKELDAADSQQGGAESDGHHSIADWLVEFAHYRFLPIQRNGVAACTFRTEPIAMVNQPRRCRRVLEITHWWQQEETALAKFVEFTVAVAVCAVSYHKKLPDGNSAKWRVKSARRV